MNFTGRELTQNWSPEESWQKLDELMRSEVQVHVGTNDLPMRVAVSVQTMIQEWDPARQTRALDDKLHELEMLRPRVTPGLIPIIDEYSRVVSTYLQSAQKSGKKPPSRKVTIQALTELNALDFHRASLKPSPRPSPDAHTKITSAQ